MPPHSGKGESDFRFYFKVFCLVRATFVTCHGNICVFVLRCGACSSSGARASHGFDWSHIDYGLRLALEEQVYVLSSTCRGQKETLSFKGFLFDDVHFLSTKGKRAPKEHMTSLTGIVQVWDFSAAQAYQCVCGSCLLLRLTVLLIVSAADWWKNMKQLLPSKMMEAEDSVRYSSSEVGRLTGRGAVPRLHAEPAGNLYSEHACNSH